MNSPRWFSLALLLLVLNVTVVLSSGWWRRARADDAPPASRTANPVDDIPLPDPLPEIPSLGSSENLQDDPAFQEFRRLFEAEEQSWNAPPPRASNAPPGPRTAEYFSALDERLAAVEQLCAATRSIAQQAARRADQGATQQSDELLRMATQLRDIAAKLLVSEL